MPLPPALSAVVAALALLVATPGRADTATEIQRLLNAGDLAGAFARSSAAMAAPAADARVRFLHGVVLMDLQRDAEALRVFESLTQTHPLLPDPFNNLAALHARAGRWEQARAALETALRNDPGHALARENLGDVYLQLALAAWRAASDAGRTDGLLRRKIRVAIELSTPPAPAAPPPSR
jgi:Flp pilus assembly protein TadD